MHWKIGTCMFISLFCSDIHQHFSVYLWWGRGGGSFILPLSLNKLCFWKNNKKWKIPLYKALSIIVLNVFDAMSLFLEQWSVLRSTNWKITMHSSICFLLFALYMATHLFFVNDIKLWLSVPTLLITSFLRASFILILWYSLPWRSFFGWKVFFFDWEFLPAVNVNDSLKLIFIFCVEKKKKKCSDLVTWLFCFARHFLCFRVENNLILCFFSFSLYLVILICDVD